MSTALDRVIGTTELLELILLRLPLDQLLRAKRISRTCRDLITKSLYIKQITAEPYISVKIKLPELCSIKNDEAAKCELQLTLYHDKPLTLCTFREWTDPPTGMLYITRIHEDIPDQDSLQPLIWGASYYTSLRRPLPPDFSVRDNMWTTYYPGRPHHSSFRLFREYPISSAFAVRGAVMKAEPGMSLVLRLRPMFNVGHLAGTQESVIARCDTAEEGIVSCALDRPLKLVAENEARFAAIA